MILPSAPSDARVEADASACLKVRFARRQIGVSVDMSPMGSHLVRRSPAPLTHRYPSPSGRTGPSPNWPPGFFPGLTASFKPVFANSRENRRIRWNSTSFSPVMALSECKSASREQLSCVTSQKFPQFSPFSVSPLVATRSVSKPSSAAQQAQAPRPRQAATQRPVRSSAQPVTSPTAGPTRAAADRGRAASRGLTNRLSKATPARAAGGLFRAQTASGEAQAPAVHQEGRSCSRRS